MAMSFSQRFSAAFWPDLEPVSDDDINNELVEIEKSNTEYCQSEASNQLQTKYQQLRNVPHDKLQVPSVVAEYNKAHAAIKSITDTQSLKDTYHQLNFWDKVSIVFGFPSKTAATFTEQFTAFKQNKTCIRSVLTNFVGLYSRVFPSTEKTVSEKTSPKKKDRGSKKRATSLPTTPQDQGRRDFCRDVERKAKAINSRLGFNILNSSPDTIWYAVIEARLPDGGATHLELIAQGGRLIEKEKTYSPKF